MAVQSAIADPTFRRKVGYLKKLRIRLVFHIMLRRFIAFIDRLSDSLYPVVVLEWRREFRNGRHAIVFTLFYTLVAVAGLIGFSFAAELDTVVGKILCDGFVRERLFWMIIFPYIYLLGFTSFFNFIVALGRSFVWRDVYKNHLPDLYLAPMDRVAIFFGSYQWWWLRMVVTLLNMLPWLVFAWALRILPLSWVLFYPLVFWTLFFTLGNMFVPLFAFSVFPQKKRPWWKELYMGIIGGFAGAALVGIPVVPLFFVCLAFFEVYVAQRPLPLDGIVDFRYWFPMFLLGVTAYNAAVRPLTRRVMQEGTALKKIAVIYGVYLAIGLSIAAIWLLLWLLFR